MTQTPRDYKETKYGTSTDNGDTWLAAESWQTIFTEHDHYLGMPDEWQQIGDAWYAMAEGYEDTSFSEWVRYADGTFSAVSRLPTTPKYTSEGDCANITDNYLYCIMREKGGSLNDDASTQTIYLTSFDLGQTWNPQGTLTEQVGIIQDPDLDLIMGTPNDGIWMLHGRQGPNTSNKSDCVAYFSDDNGATWKNRTILFQTYETNGGYTSYIADKNTPDGGDGALFAWSDEASEGVPAIRMRYLTNELDNTLEFHGYADGTVYDAYTTNFDSGDLTKFYFEGRGMAFNGPDSENFAISAQDTSEANQLAQFYIFYYNGPEIRYTDTGGSHTLYADVTYKTNYVVSAKIDMEDTESEIDWTAYNEDRTSSLGTATNKTFTSGSPTKINRIELGPDSGSYRCLSHVDYLLIRKWTTNEPALTSWSAESTGVYPG